MDTNAVTGIRQEETVKDSAKKTDQQSKTKYEAKKQTATEPKGGGTPFDKGKNEAERKLPKGLLKYDADAKKMTLSMPTKTQYQA